MLSPEESHHIRRVLRLRKGDRVELIDGSGDVYEAEIIEYRQAATLRIVAHQAVRDDSAGLTVGQGIIKTKNMELLLQKCTELGVTAMFPFVSSRCQGNVVHQVKGKGERWRKIIDQSCKQCLRTKPMILDDLVTFEAALQQGHDSDNTLRLLFWEKSGTAGLASFSELIRKSRSVILLFGPEGGFTETEVQLAMEMGWQTAGLGDRILRAETAAIAGVSIVQHYLENI